MRILCRSSRSAIMFDPPLSYTGGRRRRGRRRASPKAPVRWSSRRVHAKGSALPRHPRGRPARRSSARRLGEASQPIARRTNVSDQCEVRAWRERRQVNYRFRIVGNWCGEWSDVSLSGALLQSGRPICEVLRLGRQSGVCPLSGKFSRHGLASSTTRAIDGRASKRAR